MRRLEPLLHGAFLAIALIWLGALLLYQVFPSKREISWKRLFYRPPVLADPVTTVDEQKIKLVCDPVCYFVADGQRIKSRTDSDSAAGLPKVTLRFYDSYHGLIGYEDDNHYPNFFVIDIKDEFLQVARLKLPHINFSFEAYYPSQQLIEFRSSTGQKFLYSANKPELFIL